MESAALNNTEQQRPFFWREAFLPHEILKLVLATPGPGDCPPDRFLLRLEWIIDMCAVVEADNDIRAIADLKLDALFRRQMKFAVRPLRLKSNAFVIHIAVFAILPDQGICLKATGIGDDGMRPAGHAMQSTKRRDGRGPWTLHEMEGIHDYGLYAALLQVNAIDVAYYAQRGIRQERGELQRSTW